VSGSKAPKVRSATDAEGPPGTSLICAVVPRSVPISAIAGYQRVISPVTVMVNHIPQH
jgi:hypothetical protein